MDNTQIPSFEIPKSTEKAPSHEGGLENDHTFEAEGDKEILPAPASSQPHAPLSVPGPFATTATPSTAVPVVQQQSDDSHIIADDVDVIEKEWVDRAKKIVSLTSDNPFLETREIGKLKATYMKKRFDKDIPLPQDGVK